MSNLSNVQFVQLLGNKHGYNADTLNDSQYRMPTDVYTGTSQLTPLSNLSHPLCLAVQQDEVV